MYTLSEEGSETFANLQNLESSLPDKTKMALVFIAGYVTQTDSQASENELLVNTSCYYEKYGEYTDSLDRGGLIGPSDNACQWAFFGFILFHTKKDHVLPQFAWRYFYACF